VKIIQGIIISKFFFFFFIASNVFGSANPNISFVNVGQGNCVVVDCTDGEKLVVDCGSSTRVGVILDGKQPTEIEMGQDVQKKYFQEGINKEVVILVTHPDQDHLNLLKYIFTKGKLDEISKITLLLGGPIEDYFTTNVASDLLEHFAVTHTKTSIVSLSHNLGEESLGGLIGESNRLVDLGLKRDSEDFKDALSLYIRSNHDKFPLRGHLLGKKLEEFYDKHFADERSRFCSKFNIDLMSANAGQTPAGVNNPFGHRFVYTIDKDNNTNSVVLKLTHTISGKSAILTGDATGTTTDQILEYNIGDKEEKYLKTDVMLACHHGAHTHNSNNKRWIDATKPGTAILSCGLNQGYLHPHCIPTKEYLDAGSLQASNAHFVTCGTKNSLEEIQKNFSEFGPIREVNIPLAPKSNKGNQIKKEGIFVEIPSINKSLYNTHDSGTITAEFGPDAISVNGGVKCCH